ncbi:MAG: hypothetical protein CM1200mP16_14080 [Nitrospina sp.]|nr:MAG: hypothetical protein CM1200mP16_14080 [Nitrospina sp.]
MGLLKIPDSEWFEIFDLKERALQLAEKRKFLASIHKDVFMAELPLLRHQDVLNLMLKKFWELTNLICITKKKTLNLRAIKILMGRSFQQI